MPKRFDAFVIFAEMRTGSNYLEASLNGFDDLTCLGEVFNPTFMGNHKTFEMFGIDMDARERDPLALVDAIIGQGAGTPGFRFFHDHDPRVLERVLPDPRIAKVILTRNPLDSYVSRKIAAQTGQWRLSDLKHQRSATVRFDLDEFLEMLENLQAFQVVLQHRMQTTGQSAFYIRYEDINDIDVLNGLGRFLGSDGHIAATSDKLKKQNPSELSDKVENYDEMVTAIAGMDRFDLSSTPNFEPPRHAGVPGFMALPDTGLLFMPIKGSVTGPVADWMGTVGGVGRDGLLTRMSQKDLRHWMRDREGHRSFTVLRHPVARAYAVFNRYILPNDRPAYADVRRVLRRMYGLPIPEKGLVPGYGAAEHKLAFAAFLEFLKGNLQGQTGLKVDPAWATQTAILQGMSQVAMPDHILREDDLATALPALAVEAGATPQPFAASDDDAPFPLKAIYDGKIEKAVIEAYRRDYLGFGFARWNKR